MIKDRDRIRNRDRTRIRKRNRDRSGDRSGNRSRTRIKKRNRDRTGDGDRSGPGWGRVCNSSSPPAEDAGEPGPRADRGEEQGGKRAKPGN